MRHAYMITAHSNYDQLQILLNLLDSPENDFFIHIDKKSALPKEPLKTKYSQVKLYHEISVWWGDYSLVDATLYLLKKALGNGYDYYHLLSGQDLPLRSVDELALFFEKNKGKEFVSFDDSALEGNTEISRRAKLYHFFIRQRSMHKSKVLNKIWILIDRCVLLLQLLLNVDRCRNETFKWSYGSVWFSITDRLANYFVDNEQKIKKRCRWVNSCDELVLQTLIKNSEFYQYLYGNEPTFSNVRFINWKRGHRVAHPSTMTVEDVKQARKTEALFARKFDIIENYEAIDFLCKEIEKAKKKEEIAIGET